MASSTFSTSVTVNCEAMWAFLLDREAWAVLMPGYLHHELTSAEEMIWVFKGDFGFIQKAVKLQLVVKERIENEKITFDLVGLSDNINGKGYFEMKQLAEQYELIGHLEMIAGGFLASMINPVLEDVVPKLVAQLVDAMATALTAQNV